MNRRKRVLFVSEASYLATGYATYSREVLNRLKDRYDVAEMSIYGQVSDPRRKDIPWKNYPNQPSTEEQRQHYTQSLANQFGAWRFERACLDFRPDVVCFPPDEMIMTDYGYKRICTLKKGDMVLTHRNRFMPVKQLMRRQHTDKMVKVYINGCCDPLNLTPEHPVLVYRKKNQTNQRKSIARIYSDVEPEFVPAGELYSGDMVVIPSFDYNNSYNINITEYIDQFVEKDGYLCADVKQTSHLVPKTVECDADFATLCGYIVSDGSISERSIIVHLGLDELDYCHEVKDIIFKKFGLSCSIIEDKTSDMYRVSVSSVILARFFKKFLNGGTFTSFVPKEILLSNRDVKLGFIRGCVRGDGNYAKNTLKFNTCNKSMAYSYRSILLSLGIVCTINKTRIESGSEAYAVESHGKFADLLHEAVLKHSDINTSDNPKRSPFRVHYLETQKHAVASIRRVRREAYNGQVYNIEVEKDNSYVAQCCVHNCDIRDQWMMSFERTSPFRRIFNMIWMPTVDASPQAEEWLANYSECDGVVTYSQFAHDLLRKSCGGNIKLRGVASPCACDDYVPGNNIEAKKALGINPEHQIIGTVMRNQRRKLFPDLFKAFADFIKKTGNKDVYLYCHTGYPDHGWDFSKLLIEYGISSRVYFTYKCRCGYYAASKFADVVQQCPSCKNFTFGTTNVGESLTTKDMAKVYQSFDLYCQAACSEGFGVPVVEAAACGIPICCTDYSAMEDFKHTLTAVPIKVKTLYNELETGCNRAIIDTDHLASIFTDFFRLPVELRSIRGFHTRKAYEKNYSWDHTVKQWADFVDESPFANWDLPPVIKPSQSSVPKFHNNKDLVDWAFDLSCVDGSQAHSYEYLQTLRDLNFGMVKKGTSGFFLPEFSLFDSENYHPMTPEILLTSLNNRVNFNNYWERARVGMISLPQEDWL